MTYGEKGYRISDNKKGCKFGNHWDEDVAGDGGSRMPMFECNYDGDKQTLECCSEDNKCPAREPCETTICPIHDIEYFKGEWCDKCHPEYEGI
jgi:hypothetical protein